MSKVEYSQTSELSVQEDAPPGYVVLATVSNMMYPVDLQLLHSLFVKYGNIFRMATFNRTVKKDGKDQQALQCLIEFEKEPEATAAMQALNGMQVHLCGVQRARGLSEISDRKRKRTVQNYAAMHTQGFSEGSRNSQTPSGQRRERPRSTAFEVPPGSPPPAQAATASK
uniref:RRM domain-containing protein n=1 Tax=Chromera velia CCMP2878 TaxID=1169474 RepID=A0A0G4FLS9_9ALVE|eukprot:Cvel_17675.t1-p1 / transcript=Cvel_17675.t1 / gene=Cvel_17675 / organism=Chromera_velia_CCMP2878 / gene_product=hypothetical protein / transcript_product=hypothetical protein / location=Cvel_scaffold1424:43578-46395(+) / protein_length=168 / sequence_SO=supercontig / SO=protein_coding / is_pseudo=false